MAAAAGLATLRELTPDTYARLDALGERLGAAIDGGIEREGIDARVAVVGSLFQVFRGAGVTAFATGVAGGPTLFLGLLLEGFYLAPRGHGRDPGDRRPRPTSTTWPRPSGASSSRSNGRPRPPARDRPIDGRTGADRLGTDRAGP